MNLKQINIRKLKDNVNIILYNIKGFNINELIMSNTLCEIIGGIINETINNINFSN